MRTQRYTPAASGTLHLGACLGILATYRTAMAKNLRSGKRRVQGNEQDTQSHLQDPSTASLLDSVQAEVQRLQKENEELLASLERDRRVSLGRRSEAEQLLEEQRQIHEDLQAELVESQERSCALEERCTQLEEQLTSVLAEARAEAELERLRAVEELRRKYDDREERFLQQLQELQERFLTLQSRTCAVWITPPCEADSDGAKATTDSISGEVDAPTTGEVSNVGTLVQPAVVRGIQWFLVHPQYRRIHSLKGMLMHLVICLQPCWLNSFLLPSFLILMEEMPRQRIRSKIGSANLNLWPRFIGGISKPNLCI